MEVNMRAFQGGVRDFRLVHGPCPRNEGAARAEQIDDSARDSSSPSPASSVPAGPGYDIMLFVRCSTESAPRFFSARPVDSARLFGLSACSAIVLLAASAVPLQPALHAEDRDPPGRVVEDFLRGKLEQAQKDFAAGRYEKALATAEAILELCPEFTSAREAADLKLKAKDRLQGRDYVHGRVSIEPSECMVGEKATVTLSLRNVHTGRIEILLDSGGESPWSARNLPFAQAHFSFSETGCDGGTLTDSWSHTIPDVEGVIGLEPGGEWEKRFDLDTGDRSPLKATKRVYVISAVLRPSRITAGEKAVFRPVTLEAASLTVFPRGYRILKADPKGAMKRALEDELAVNMFIAAHFVSDGDYGEALAGLVGALGGSFDDPRMKRAILAALAVLTRRPVPNDVGAWPRWWEKNRGDVEKGR